jgi:hypothetical protein
MANGHNTYTHDNSTAPGIALAHTVYGSPVTASLRPEMAQQGTTRQVQSTFRDYQPPKRRAHDKGHPLCSEPDCKSYPVQGKNYCTGHGRLHGEAKVCAHRDCKAAPKTGEDYCRWHGKSVVTVDESD